VLAGIACSGSLQAEEPAPAPEALLTFAKGHHRWVFRAADLAGADLRRRLIATLAAQGYAADAPTQAALRTLEAHDGGAGQDDARALVAGAGTLPKDYVPTGTRPAEPLPPLAFLGGRVRLELHDGEARALLLDVPEGSPAAGLGLRVGDSVLRLDEQAVAPGVLLPWAEDVPAAAAPRRLVVRRTRGELETLDAGRRAGASAGR
jgi:hypothetical protein